VHQCGNEALAQRIEQAIIGAAAGAATVFSLLDRPVPTPIIRRQR
jgi:hypothetical protein